MCGAQQPEAQSDSTESLEDEGILPIDPDVGIGGNDVEEQSPPTDSRVDHGPPRDRVPVSVLAAIAAGGALGSVARYAVLTAMPAGVHSFPWSTFLVNVSGSFVLAVLVVLIVEYWPPSTHIRPFWAIGFLGGYTTFSTAAVEIDELVIHGALSVAALYALGSLLAGSAAVAFGFLLARAVIMVAQRQ